MNDFSFNQVMAEAGELYIFWGGGGSGVVLLGSLGWLGTSSLPTTVLGFMCG